MALNMDDLNGMSEEELMRFFEQMFMNDIAGSGGVKAIDINSISDNPSEIEMFEELMKQLILPHLMMGGKTGAIDSVKVLKINNPNFGKENKKPTDPDADTSWLDDYLK